MQQLPTGIMLFVKNCTWWLLRIPKLSAAQVCMSDRWKVQAVKHALGGFFPTSGFSEGSLSTQKRTFPCQLLMTCRTTGVLAERHVLNLSRPPKEGVIVSVIAHGHIDKFGLRHGPIKSWMVRRWNCLDSRFITENYTWFDLSLWKPSSTYFH